jgi:hypothetical protein
MAMATVHLVTADFPVPTDFLDRGKAVAPLELLRTGVRHHRTSVPTVKGPGAA